MPPAAGTSIVRAVERWPGVRCGGGSRPHPGLREALRGIAVAARSVAARSLIFEQRGGEFGAHGGNVIGLIVDRAGFWYH